MTRSIAVEPEEMDEEFGVEPDDDGVEVGENDPAWQLEGGDI